MDEAVFRLHPDNLLYWEVANELQGDFRPSTVTSYLSAWIERGEFRTTYQRFMVFANAAHDAQGK